MRKPLFFRPYRPLCAALLLLMVAGASLFAIRVFGTDFESTSFTLENPVTVIEGGESESSSFKYISNTGQLSSGEAASTSFIGRTGNLYFPTADSPVVAVAALDGSVTVSWTAATGVLANITSYSVGISSSAGGSYNYTSVGTLLSHTYTGLTNGATYYFRVRAYAAGVLLATSDEVPGTPVASTVVGGGGGGGGGGTVVAQTNVIFAGRAFPLSRVTVLKDAQTLVSTIAGPDSNFYVAASGLSTGDYTFSVYGEDADGIRSAPFTFSVSITSGITTTIGGIYIAPTISVDKKEVRKGDPIAIFGRTVPESAVTIEVNSETQHFITQEADDDGIYLLNFDSAVLELGSHSAKSKSASAGQISSISRTVGFLVGDKNVLADGESYMKGDLNDDLRVNLVDFSIAAFWYQKTLAGAIIAKETNHLNADGRIDLRDFSIMAFYWTG